MTRDELKENIELYLLDEIDTELVMVNVDLYTSALLQQHGVIGSSDVLPGEDDEDYQPEPECSICGKVEGHHQGCPEDDSPFALLQRRGYD